MEHWKVVILVMDGIAPVNWVQSFNICPYSKKESMKVLEYAINEYMNDIGVRSFEIRHARRIDVQPVYTFVYEHDIHLN